MKLKTTAFARPGWTHVRITARQWHYAALVLLCLLNLALGVRLLYAWKRAQAGDAARLQEREAEYRMMQLKTRPLRGLAKKIARANADQTAFYHKRFPNSYSEVLTELGSLAVKNNVLLGRVQYAPGKLDEGTYRVQMDASLSGDYAPVVRFINGLERDHIFFLINGIALSGQQNGIVSLRMRLTTFLRSDGNPAAAPVATASAPNPRNLATEQR
ncbi:MAG TPA: hypothetical protein VFN53_04250 [Acidobacteriaceae bacterium]|nr:hypothetical protein [Acidobacteriaceae bacterium]